MDSIKELRIYNSIIESCNDEQNAKEIIENELNKLGFTFDSSQLHQKTLSSLHLKRIKLYNKV